MIRESQRRRQAAPEAWLSLHLRSARRLVRFERAGRAAAGAAAAALLLLVVRLFMPLPLTVAFAVTAVVALVLAAWPVASRDQPALDDIASKSGFAYAAALELLASRAEAGLVAVAPDASAAPSTAPGPADEFGLEADLLARARRSVADYRPPAEARWWLPLTVVTLALLVLPSLLSFNLPTGAPSTGGRPPGTPPAFSEEPVQPDDAGMEDPLGLPDVAERATPPEPDPGAFTNSEPPPPGAAPPASETSDQALSRFLDTVRQGERQGERESSNGGSGGSDAGLSGAAPEGATRASPADSRADDAPPSQSSTAGQEGAPGSSAEQPSDTAGQASPEAASAAELSSTDPSSSEEGDAAAPNAQESGKLGGREEGEGDEAGSGTGEELGAGLGVTPEQAGAGAGGTEPSGRGETDAGGSAGVGGTALDDTAERAPGVSASGRPELLPGAMLDGPIMPAGTVRLPGDDQVELPPGTALGPYGQAAEEALGEGDLPAAYQEIIRRYFR